MTVILSFSKEYDFHFGMMVRLNKSNINLYACHFEVAGIFSFRESLSSDPDRLGIVLENGANVFYLLF